MITRNHLIIAMVAVLAACSPRNEFEHQTVEAYQQNKSLRTALLSKCDAHVAQKVAFATNEDTEECKKAYRAQQDVNFATMQQRKSDSAHAALQAALGH